jgi:hypothetical protein
VAVSAASAAKPEFKPASGKFTSKSGTSILSVPAVKNVVTCKKDTNKGEITSPTSVGHVVVTFTECESKIGTTAKACTVKSKSPKGVADNEIITNTLKGDLGTSKEATDGVALVLEPASGKVFVELESECLTVSPAKVEGMVAGEVTPTEKSQKTGKLIYELTGTEQKIKKVNGVTAKLDVDTLEATEESLDEIGYEKATEVT